MRGLLVATPPRVEVDRSSYKRLPRTKTAIYCPRCHKNHLLSRIWAWLYSNDPKVVVTDAVSCRSKLTQCHSRGLGFGRRVWCGGKNLGNCWFAHIANRTANKATRHRGRRRGRLNFVSAEHPGLENQFESSKTRLRHSGFSVAVETALHSAQSQGPFRRARHCRLNVRFARTEAYRLH